MCARDYEANGYLNVKDSNPSWADFGWEDRADWFQNGGVSCAVTVYSDRNYAGLWVRKLQRGETAEAFFKNTTSSNKWCV